MSISARTAYTLNMRINHIRSLIEDEGICQELSGISKLEAENPAIKFTKMAKGGKFDKLSDEDYADLLHIVEQESQICFDSKPTAVFDTANDWADCCSHLHSAIELMQRIITAGECSRMHSDKAIKKALAGEDFRDEAIQTAGNATKSILQPEPDEMVLLDQILLDILGV